jgi:uncharacterized protein GlcG (DUF336 family)
MRRHWGFEHRGVPLTTEVLLPNITSLDGGVPIRLGNDVIGGAGVAGSPGKDEQCANAGLEKVNAALQ